MADTLEYISRPPQMETGTPPPLLVLFHGYGANMHDLIGLADVVDPRLHVLAAQAPIDLGMYGMPGGCAWFNLQQDSNGEIQYDLKGALESISIAADFVSNATTNIECDASRVMVMGFSQGAMLAHALLLQNRIPLAGIAACSGRLVDALFDDQEDARKNAAPGLPVLLTHGTHDDLIPIHHGHALRDFYESTPADMTWVEEPIGHGIGPRGIEGLAEWSRKIAGD
ncbi:MAG: hypothetical protein VX527_07495 [Planctomycetota bacterium]|nr:hypothetical protein [Planctomycetota bacterium]